MEKQRPKNLRPRENKREEKGDHISSGRPGSAKKQSEMSIQWSNYEYREQSESSSHLSTDTSEQGNYGFLTQSEYSSVTSYFRKKLRPVKLLCSPVRACEPERVVLCWWKKREVRIKTKRRDGNENTDDSPY